MLVSLMKVAKLTAPPEEDDLPFVFGEVTEVFSVVDVLIGGIDVGTMRDVAVGVNSPVASVEDGGKEGGTGLVNDFLLFTELLGRDDVGTLLHVEEGVLLLEVVRHVFLGEAVLSPFYALQ